MHSSLPVINPSRKKILQLKNAIGKSFVHINHHEHLKQLIYCVLDQYSHEEFSMWIKQCVTTDHSLKRYVNYSVIFMLAVPTIYQPFEM